MSKLLNVYRVEWHTICFRENKEVNGERGQRQTKLVAAENPTEVAKMIPTPEQNGDGTEIRNNVLTTRLLLPNVLVES